MKENLFLRKDLLELSTTKFISAWQLYQKNVYTDELDDKWIIVNEYNNTYHTIKMKPVDVAYIFSSKDPKFNNGDNVRISKHKKVFAKGYTPNWSEVFGIS